MVLSPIRDRVSDVAKEVISTENQVVLPVTNLENPVIHRPPSMSSQMDAVEQAIRKLQSLTGTNDLKLAVRKTAFAQEQLDLASMHCSSLKPVLTFIY